MSSKDKNSLLTLFFLIATILSFVVFIKTTKFIPLLLVGGLIVVYQYTILVPSICKKYYASYEMESGWIRWVPFINEVHLMPQTLALVSIALLVGSVLVLGVSIIPISFTSKMMQPVTAMDLPFKAVVVAVVLVTIFQILVGVNYILIFSDVNTKVARISGGSYNKQITVLYVLCLIPFVRIESLGFLKNRLDFLVNYLNVDNDENIYEMEE